MATLNCMATRNYGTDGRVVVGVCKAAAHEAAGHAICAVLQDYQIG